MCFLCNFSVTIQYTYIDSLHNAKPMKTKRNEVDSKIEMRKLCLLSKTQENWTCTHQCGITHIFTNDNRTAMTIKHTYEHKRNTFASAQDRRKNGNEYHAYTLWNLANKNCELIHMHRHIQGKKWKNRIIAVQQRKNNYIGKGRQPTKTSFIVLVIECVYVSVCICEVHCYY